MRALVVLAVLVAAIASACGGSNGESAAPPTAMATTPSGSMRQPAPPLEGVSLDGEAITLEGLRGRPVLLNVWSSW